MKTGLKGIVKVFPVDYNPINASDFRYPWIFNTRNII